MQLALDSAQPQMTASGRKQTNAPGATMIASHPMRLDFPVWIAFAFWSSVAMAPSGVGS